MKRRSMALLMWMYSTVLQHTRAARMGFRPRPRLWPRYFRRMCVRPRPRQVSRHLPSLFMLPLWRRSLWRLFLRRLSPLRHLFLRRLSPLRHLSLPLTSPSPKVCLTKSKYMA